jgi:hypothetical protein
MTTWVYVSGVGRLSGLMHLSVIECSHARTTTKIRTLVTNATRPSYQHTILCVVLLRLKREIATWSGSTHSLQLPSAVSAEEVALIESEFAAYGRP